MKPPSIIHSSPLMMNHPLRFDFSLRYDRSRLVEHHEPPSIILLLLEHVGRRHLATPRLELLDTRYPRDAAVHAAAHVRRDNLLVEIGGERGVWR